MSASHVIAGQSASIEASARRRIAQRLLPFLFLLFVIAFLDRVNVSFAALEMTQDLGFSDRVFGLGSGIFFVGYLLFEIPGCLIVERWSARNWFARIMVSWGLVTALMAFIKTPTHFYAVRTLLGAAEAGFFPGVIVYLSHWFRAADRAKAGSVFMIAIPVANIVGSPLAGWLLGVHWLHVQGWRWLFIVEGVPAVVCGMLTTSYLTDWPREAKWLTRDESEWITAELEREAAEKRALRNHRVWETLAQPVVLQLTLIYFCCVSCSYGLTIWLPTFLKRASGASDLTITLLTMLPYLLLLAAMLLNGWHSDHTGERRWHTVAPLMLCVVSFVIAILAGGNFWLAFVGLAFASTANAFMPAFWAIPYAFLADSGAAASTGLINSLGNLGGLVAPWVIGYFLDRTHSFTPGFLYVIGSLLLAIVLVLGLPKPPRAIRSAAP
jgi:MFS transporter, ACS family, tartrate transporter